MHSSIGEKLKALRINNDFTQKQVADYLNMDQGHLSNIERGKRNVTVDVLEDLCNLYNCSLSYLLGESDEYSPARIAFRGSKEYKDLALVAKMNEIMNNMEFLRKLDDD